MVGGFRDVITCAEFQIEIFMGYDFTGGRIIDFPIDFSMGLTTVQRYCAACDTIPIASIGLRRHGPVRKPQFRMQQDRQTDERL